MRYSKENLRGFWLQTLPAMIMFSLFWAIFFLPVALSFFLAWPLYVSIIFIALAVLALPAFNLSLVKFSLSIVGDEPQKVKVVFFGFKHYLKAVVFSVVVGVRVLLWSLLFIVPGIIEAMKLSQVFNELAHNPKVKLKDALRASKRHMSNRVGDYFKMMLIAFPIFLISGVGTYLTVFWSVSGNLLLIPALLVTIINLLWVTPLVLGMVAAFYLDLNNEIDDAYLEKFEIKKKTK